MSLSRTRRRLSRGKSRVGAARLAAAASIPFLASAARATAPSYTWYGSDSVAGGAGNWNTSSSAWTLNGTTFVAWPSTGTTNVANFASTGGNVTINGNVSVNTIDFTASGYSLLSNGGAILTLNGINPTINTGGYNVTFAMAANSLTLAAGDTTIYKSGVGTLTILNSQNGTGAIGSNTTWNISGGTLNTSTGLYNSEIAIADGTELGALTGNVLDLNGASLVFTASGGMGYDHRRTINVGSGGGAICDGGFAPGMGTAGGSTISPNITIAAGNGLNLIAADLLDCDGTGSGIFSGAGGIAVYGGSATSFAGITGNGSVYGPGTVELLSTSNTYTGGTTIEAGALLVSAGNSLSSASTSSLGNVTGSLTVAGAISLMGNQTVGVLTSIGGNGTVTTSNGDTLDFKIGNGAITHLSASSAVISGASGIELDASPATSSITPGNYTLISSAGGGLNGGTIVFAGGQNLTVPANSAIENIGGTNYRLTLGGNATAVVVTVATAPAHTINVMPLGASITAGESAQPVYNGGGYRAQLYENLVNDGRFTPEFVGSQNSSLANNPTGPDLMTAVGQPNNEGHPGYTTTEVLANLNSGANWLSVGNGVNPDYITLNIGGNDFVGDPDNTTAINNLQQIITELATLRPNATIIVSNILYRGDGSPAGEYSVGPNGTGFENLYNPYIPGLVYNAVLAGEHVSFVDLYDLITPNNSLALIGPDDVHPTQAGYDLMGNAWYTAITTGQAFYTGNAGSTWNASGSGNTTSWALDYQRTTDAGAAPGNGTDVYFNGVGGNTTLGADFSVRSVNFTAGANTSVTIGGTNTLTIGAGGITVQAGTVAHTISSAVSLGSAQIWSNVSTSPFAVSGNISGNGPLTIGGTGLMVFSGNNTYTSLTTLSGGTLCLGNTNALAGGGNITFAGGTLQFTGNNTKDYSTRIVNSTSSMTIDTNGQNPTFAGVLGDSNTAGLTKAGNGTLFLSNAGNGDEYTGGVILSAGTLNINGIDGLGVAPDSPAIAITFAGNSTLQLAAGFNAFTAFNVNRTISLATAGVTGTIDTNGFGNMTTPELIVGNGMLGKRGIGTLILSASNTYSGGTSITGGTLRANNTTGSATGSGNITVGIGNGTGYSGGILGGSGNVSGAVILKGSTTAENGGIIAAGSGNTAVGIGTLTTGNQTWNGGGAYQWKITGNGTGAAGTKYDLLRIGTNSSGTLTVNTTAMAAFTIAPSGSLTGVANGVYNWDIAQIGTGNATEISVTGINGGSPFGPGATPLTTGFGSGAFAVDTAALSVNGGADPVTPSLFSLYFETVGSNNDLVLSYNAAPEPVTALLMLAGTLPVLLGRRRRLPEARPRGAKRME